MTVSDAQVRRLMEEMSEARQDRPGGDAGRHGPEDGAQVRERGEAAVGAGEAADVADAGGPVRGGLGGAQARAGESPELEAKTLFEWLMVKYPGRYAGAAADAAAACASWRAAHGPDQEVFFAQDTGRARPRRRTSRAYGAGGHNRRPAFRAHALRLRSAVLELAMGHGLPVGIDHGDAPWRAGRALPTRTRAASTTRPTTRRRRRTASRSRSADGRSARSTPSISRDAALRDEAAHDGGRREGAKRRRRIEQRRTQAPSRAGLLLRGSRDFETRGVQTFIHDVLRKANGAVVLG